MTTLAQAQDALVDRLNTAGIRAVADERDVNPPCVFVPAPAVTYRFGRGSYDATYPLVLVVPDGGRAANMIALGDLLDAVQIVLGWEGVSAAPASFILPDGAPPLPAYTLTYAQHIQ